MTLRVRKGSLFLDEQLVSSCDKVWRKIWGAPFNLWRRLGRPAGGVVRCRERKYRIAPRLDLQHIAVPGNHLVQHGINEKADEEAGDEAGNDDDGEWPLSIRSNAGGQGRRQQSQARDESRHHDWAQA
jgi:hypothetical protein